MIDKKSALQIAMRIIPDLMNRGYLISDQFPGPDLKLPPNCWYVKYSSVPLNYSACGNGKTLYLCIDMETGQVIK